MLFTLCDAFQCQLARRGWLTYAPDTSQVFPRTCLEDLHIESMPNTMRSSRNTSQTSSNDGNLWSSKLRSRPWRVGRKKLIQKPLDELVEENEGMKDWILHFDDSMKDKYISRRKLEGREKEEDRNEHALYFVSKLGVGGDTKLTSASCT